MAAVVWIGRRASLAGALAIGLLGCAPLDAAAQEVADLARPAATVAIARVTVDLAAGAFDRALPFDVPFFIAGRAPQGMQALSVQYAEMPKSGDVSTLVWRPQEPARWQPVEPGRGDSTFLVLVRAPLDAGRSYRVRFAFHGDRSADTVVVAEGRTEQKNYVSVDAGVLFAGAIDIGAVYVGTNIYFRPVNKDAPLGTVGSLGRRLAVTIGLTISSLADENERTRSDLFWNQSLVLGAGYRISSSVRGGAGILVCRESDPNPLVTRKTAAITWYGSLSVDLDLMRGIAR